jgi:threonylcarbamoyladenosine tRNA methylthiotransferase MtaB
MTRIAFYTLGCKSNQYETNEIARDARERGFQVTDFRSPADVYIINTCTVTENADRKARNVIRLAKKRNPNAKVIVTGCYSEVYPKEIEKLGVADNIVRNCEKRNIISGLGLACLPARQGAWSLKQKNPASRVRENLMIEDGCEEFCKYCIVPFARGKVKTKPIDQVIQEAKSLVNSGAKEIVLTGINLGAYGAGLPALISKLAKIRSLQRLRLSSIEPMYITNDIIKAIMANPKVCRHLHIPMQSGSTKVLKAMGRRYTAEDYAKLIGKIKKDIPGVALNTDVIVGFLGETEKDFKSTVRSVKDLKFSRIHAFHFSARPGTAAAKMKDKVTMSTILKRADEMRRLRIKLMANYVKSLKVHPQEVLVESKDKKTGMLEGLTEGYIRIFFKGDKRLIGKLARVRITGLREEFCIGRMI